MQDSGAPVTIARVHARAVAVPLRRPTRISTRVLGARHFLLVEVCDDAGVTGSGYAYAGTNGGPLLATAVRDVLAPVVLDGGADDIPGVWARMYQESLLIGRRGALVRAISAVDIALWDLRARQLGVSLAVLLGGAAPTAVPAYASGGYYRPDGDPADAVRAEIAAHRGLGFRDHKIKVGGLTVAEDADRVAAAIAAIEGTGRLALDANNAYRTVDEALRAARAFERAAGPAGVWWFEEPLSPEDVAGHAELARTLETAVATGEIHQTRWDFRRLIEQRAADILQPDAGVLGGVSEYLLVANAAACHDVPIAPHWHANLHAQVSAALPHTLAVEYFDLADDIYNFETLVTEDTRLRVADGHVLVSDRPGIGIELDEEAVARYRCDLTDTTPAAA